MKKRNKSLLWAANQFLNRSLQGISLRHDRGWAKPTRVIGCVTLRCNIKCQQCAIWRLPRPDSELTTDEWKRVIDDLREWIGPCRIQLAGGETFVRKDICEIVRHATERGVLTGVVSNGTLITRDLAREIVDSGLGYIHISVDGIEPETHDSIRGIPGLHAKTMDGIRNLMEAKGDSGMSICIASIIMKRNMSELTAIVDMVDKEPRLDGVIFNPLGPTFDSEPDWYKNNPLFFDNLDEANRVLDQLKVLRKRGSKILNPPEQFEGMKGYFKTPSVQTTEHCMVGITNLSITCDGFIHTCFKQDPIANVKNVLPSKAWDSAAARENRRRIRACSIHCSPANFVYRRSLFSEIIRYLKFG